MSYLAPQIGKYFENLDDIDHFTIASYCRDVINSLEKILDLSLLNSENRNPKTLRFLAKCGKGLDQGLHVLPEDDCIVNKVQICKYFLTKRCPRSPEPTVRPINYSIQTLNRKGTRTQPCLTLVSTGKNSDVSPPHLTALSLPK